MKTINVNIENNRYYQNNPTYFLELKQLVEQHPCTFSRTLHRTGYKLINGKTCYFKEFDKTYLKNWIDINLPLLADKSYTYATKCYWIFHNITDFPRCKNEKCKKQLKQNVGVFGGYPQFCNTKCANSDINRTSTYRQKLVKHYGEDLKGFKKLISNGWKEHIENDENFISDVKAKRQKTNIKNGHDKNYTNRDKARETCNKNHGVDNPFQIPSVIEHNKQICRTRYNCDYFLQVPEIYQKGIDKIFKTYGVYNVAQSSEIRSKIQKRYTYNGILFDSSWELCLYEYLSDHSIDFIYQPNSNFTYTDRTGKLHYYMPDFLLTSSQQFIEIKGDHFFTSDGLPIRNNKYPWFEKYECMVKNNILILTSIQLAPVFAYIEQKYNVKSYKTYVKKFKNI